MRKKNLGQYNYIKKLMAMANNKKKGLSIYKKLPFNILKKS
jgi:hypothetical protein